MNSFCSALDFSYLCRCAAKVGCGSEKKINRDLFCFSLTLHYLCTRITLFFIMKKNSSIMTSYLRHLSAAILMLAAVSSAFAAKATVTVTVTLTQNQTITGFGGACCDGAMCPFGNDTAPVKLLGLPLRLERFAAFGNDRETARRHRVRHPLVAPR